MIKLKFAFAAFAALVSGCATFQGPSSNPSMMGLTTTEAETRVASFITTASQCPSTDNSQSGGALVASFAGDFIFNLIDNAIQSYRRGLTGQFVASGILGASPNSGSCMVIGRGVLAGDVDPSFQQQASPLSEAQLRRLGLADTPAFYMEATVSWDTTNTHMTLTPQLLSYAGTSARVRGSGRKNVSLVLIFSEPVQEAAADSSDADLLAVYRFNLGQLEIGRHYPAALLNYSGASQAITPASLASANMSVLVTESEEPGPALEALSAAYESNKGDLQSAFENLISSAVGGDEGQ